MEQYRIEKGVIYCAEGIPQLPRWFTDSRLTFQFDKCGITQVDYRNPKQKRGNNTIFVRRIRDGFRYFLECNGITYKPEYTNVEVWPFGLQAEWIYNGVVLKHKVLAVDEAIIIQLITPETILGGIRFKLEFHEAFALSGSEFNDYNYFSHGMVRKWKPWEYVSKDNALYGGFHAIPEENAVQPTYTVLSNNPEVTENDKSEVDLNICVTADFPINYEVRAAHLPLNARHILKSNVLEGGKVYSFIITFAPSKDEARGKSRQLKGNIAERIARQFARYKEVADHSPMLISPYKDLNDFMSLIPMYHESLKITDCPGAIRAKTTHYGVWGWDGMTANHATAYWGDIRHIRDMLRFYEQTAHPKLGIGHAFNNDLSVASISAVPAQGMYITLLQLYYAASGDIEEIKAHYPFAKRLFNLIVEKEIKGTGLCEGTSLYPDYPEFTKETGCDISAFNNTIFYCAARSMEYLAALMGDETMQKRAGDIFNKIEDNFIKLFYDPDKRFVVSSIDSKTLEQRHCYDIAAIKWENGYCRELVEPIMEDTLEFFVNNVISEAGLREIPLWDEAFDGDSNQLHCWWPVITEYFIRLVNETSRKDLIEQWIGWVSRWTRKLMCPEGISYYIETDDPDVDGWHTLPGTWHGYSMRGWYQAVIHGVIGLDIEAGGLTFYPYSGQPMMLKGLHYMGKTFDIEMMGSGKYIEWIEVDGRRIKGTNKLPADLYDDKEHINVKVQRTDVNPYSLYIKYAYGLTFTDYRYDDKRITMKVTGAGLCRLKIWAQNYPQVTIDGRAASVSYDEAHELTTVEVKIRPDEVKEVEILG